MTDTLFFEFEASVPQAQPREGKDSSSAKTPPRDGLGGRVRRPIPSPTRRQRVRAMVLGMIFAAWIAFLIAMVMRG